jgi:hypothetical protein
LADFFSKAFFATFFFAGTSVPPFVAPLTDCENCGRILDGYISLAGLRSCNASAYTAAFFIYSLKQAVRLF